MAVLVQKNSKLQDQLLDQVHEEIQLRSSYIMLLVFSTIIATLGLLINSTAVVIGAMLIAPLFWPIMGVTLSLFTTQRHMARHAARSIVVSVLVVLVVSAVLAWLTPFSGISDEIRARLSPTILDLFIALASSVIGVMALYYPRISSTATGVAISISLLPPLAVSGIGIALMDWEIFWRSFLLFGTNIGAMVFAGIITLYVLRFRPRAKDEQRFKIGVGVSVLVLIVLSVPLSLYLRNSLQETRMINQISTVLDEQVHFIASDGRVDEVSVVFDSRLTEATVNATVFLPEGVFLTVAQQNQMISALTDSIGRSVALELNVVNNLVLRRQEDERLRELRSLIEDSVRIELAALSPTAIIETIDIEIISEDEGQISNIHITLLLRQAGETPLTFEQKELLEGVVNDAYPQPISMTVEFVPVETLTAPDPSTRNRTVLEEGVVRGLQLIDERIYVNQTTVQEQGGEFNVVSQVVIPQEVGISTGQVDAIAEQLEESVNASVQLDVVILRYDSPLSSDDVE